MDELSTKSRSCFNQERLPITYRNFHHKSLVRLKSKSRNWQGSQPISYKAKLCQKDDINLADQKYNISYQNIWEKLTSTDFYAIKCLTWQKSYLTTYMDELSTKSRSCFNQERLPITYRNFHHKSLVRLKSKSRNWQGSQPISYKAKLCQKDDINLADQKYNISYQNIWEKLTSTDFYAIKCLTWQKSYLTTYMDDLSTKSRSLF